MSLQSSETPEDRKARMELLKNDPLEWVKFYFPEGVTVPKVYEWKDVQFSMFGEAIKAGVLMYDLGGSACYMNKRIRPGQRKYNKLFKINQF